MQVYRFTMYVYTVKKSATSIPFYMLNITRRNIHTFCTEAEEEKKTNR